MGGVNEDAESMPSIVPGFVTSSLVRADGEELQQQPKYPEWDTRQIEKIVAAIERGEFDIEKLTQRIESEMRKVLEIEMAAIDYCLKIQAQYGDTDITSLLGTELESLKASCEESGVDPIEMAKRRGGYQALVMVAKNINKLRRDATNYRTTVENLISAMQLKFPERQEEISTLLEKLKADFDTKYIEEHSLVGDVPIDEINFVLRRLATKANISKNTIITIVTISKAIEVIEGLRAFFWSDTAKEISESNISAGFGPRIGQSW